MKNRFFKTKMVDPWNELDEEIANRYSGEIQEEAGGICIVGL